MKTLQQQADEAERKRKESVLLRAIVLLLLWYFEYHTPNALAFKRFKNAAKELGLERVDFFF